MYLQPTVSLHLAILKPSVPRGTINDDVPSNIPFPGAVLA